MPRLHPCPQCGRHVQARATHCPHCNTQLDSPTLTPRGAALGLALASTVACTSGIGSGEPDYGVSIVDTSEQQDTGDTSDSGQGKGGEAGEGGEAGGDAEGGDAD